MKTIEAGEIIPTASQPITNQNRKFSGLMAPENFILAAIVVVGLVIRWSNLLVLEPFADEKLHIQGGLAAQSGRLDTTSMLNLIGISRVVQSWFLAVIYFVFSNENLLLLGRAFSGFSGIIIIITSYKIGELLFSKRAGLLAAGIWAITPLAVWHERMNLADPLQATYTGLVIYFSLLLLRLDRGRKCNLYSFLLGLSLAAAFLAKFNAFLIIPVPVLAALFLYPPARWKAFIARLFLTYYVAALLVLPILFLGRNDLGTYQREKQIALPNFQIIIKNFGGIFDWFYAYLTLPLFVLIVLSIGLAFFRGDKAARFLVVAGLFPLLGQGLFLVVDYSRYFLFVLLPLTILAGWALDRILNRLNTTKFAINNNSANKWAVGIGIFVLAMPMVWFDWQSVTSPSAAALPIADRIQYISGVWSGTGVRQVVSFLANEQAKAGTEVVVFTSPTIPSQAIEVEVYGKPQYKLVQVDLIPGVDLKPGVDYVKLDQAYTGLPAYFVAMTPYENAFVNEYSKIYPDLKFVPVLTVPKPDNNIQWQVYRLDHK